MAKSTVWSLAREHVLAARSLTPARSDDAAGLQTSIAITRFTAMWDLRLHFMSTSFLRLTDSHAISRGLQPARLFHCVQSFMPVREAAQASSLRLCTLASVSFSKHIPEQSAPHTLLIEQEQWHTVPRALGADHSLIAAAGDINESSLCSCPVSRASSVAGRLTDWASASARRPVVATPAVWPGLRTG